MKNQGFAERLSAQIGWKKKGKFARAIGIQPVQLSRYLKGQVPDLRVLFKLAEATGKSVEWLVTGADVGQKPASAMMVAESQAPYGATPDLTREEKELVRMLLAVLRGRNRENVQAIKSNIKAFYKSREMDSEPMLPTQRKAAG